MQHPTKSIIDLDLGTKLAGNKPDLARELLLFLAKNITNDVSDIQAAHHNHDFILLKSLTHKLHGAITYCGTPHLQAIISELNTALKAHPTESLDELVTTLATAADQLVKQTALMAD